MEVTLTGSVETDIHGLIDKLYAFATSSVLCMGLPDFEHSVAPNLHRCTGPSRSPCILLDPKCTVIHKSVKCTYAEIPYCGMSSPVVR